MAQSSLEAILVVPKPLNFRRAQTISKMEIGLQFLLSKGQKADSLPCLVDSSIKLTLKSSFKFQSKFNLKDYRRGSREIEEGFWERI